MSWRDHARGEGYVVMDALLNGVHFNVGKGLVEGFMFMFMVRYNS
jgi:hypothetical protein